MPETRASYRLRQFTSSTAPGFAEALRIYSRSFPPSLKTDTNEITYWLDNYSDRYDDRMLSFGFYVNQALAGYAQLAYFVEERLLVIDYIVVEKAYRRPNVFLEFVEHLRTAVEQMHMDVDYIVGEVGLIPNQHGARPDAHTRGLLRLLRSVGFGVAKAPYIQPQLGWANKESRTPAALVIDTGERTSRRRIMRETYLSIVQTIYYKHYVRWFSIYKDRAAEYVSHVTELFEQIQANIPEGTLISINGHTQIESSGKSSVRVLDADLIRFARVILVAFAVLLTFCIFTALILLIKRFTGASYRSLSVVFTLVLFAFFALLTPFYPVAERVLDRIVAIIPFVARPNRVARHRRYPRNITSQIIQHITKSSKPRRSRKPKK